jgi:transcriptional regulator with XRE-family HTH domain
MSSVRNQIAESLKDKESRERYVSEHISQGIAIQIREMRKDRGLTQAALGALIGAPQARISQIENPDFGSSYNLSTLENLASRFDVGLLVEFVPFSTLLGWKMRRSTFELIPPCYDHDPGLQEPVGQGTRALVSAPVTLTASRAVADKSATTTRPHHAKVVYIGSRKPRISDTITTDRSSANGQACG